MYYCFYITKSSIYLNLYINYLTNLRTTKPIIILTFGVLIWWLMELVSGCGYLLLDKRLDKVDYLVRSNRNVFIYQFFVVTESFWLDIVKLSKGLQ